MGKDTGFGAKYANEGYLPPSIWKNIGAKDTLRQTPDTDDDVWVDCGATVSTPVGFARSPLPEWDAPGSYHQFDPSEESEDT